MLHVSEPAGSLLLHLITWIQCVGVFFRTHLQRCYLFFVWNAILSYEIVTGKRDKWIGIRNFHVIYEKDGLIVLNKHPDLLINHENPWLYCLTLQMQLFFNRPCFANWKLNNMFHFVNRLDYATSGLICIASDRLTAGIVGKAFNKKMVGRHYLAVVWGHVGAHKFPEESAHVTTIRPNVYHVQMTLGGMVHKWPCGKQQKLVTYANYTNCENPRKSSTYAIVLEHGQLYNQPASRLLLIPNTGRRHQLRVHCAMGLGHPITGDLIYTSLPFDQAQSTSVKRDDTSPLNHKLERMALHAFHLNIVLRSGRPAAQVHCHRRTDGNSSRDSCVLELYTEEPKFFSVPTAWRSDQTFYELDSWRNIYSP
ncbi:RNA pseudouridylate synthase domain-containing protein 1 [Paragonimus heterotremus]|uniref:RNA pseudouridylate synthase domain-containing protein 1 n=1 Tax=Paragonimus heterotremus TaxID=100268 RepID=A0A8J4T0V7_9TREM|nr:RNA pseudouridylate synthase domain-containing protein 1 [Paragonimus heterotremus]